MELSKEERELYDRQIRLWGLDGQNTLRNARILLLGFESVAVEVVKNLCLAGVGALTLQSSLTLDSEDLAYNFFVRSENIGENAAQASTVGVQRLNPRVAVDAETRPLSELDEEFLTSYNVVLTTQAEDREQLIRINKACRRANRAFYYCNHRGWAGIVFVDLGEKPFKFMLEKEVIDKTSKPGKVNATQEILHVKPPVEGSTKEKLTVSETFNSLADSLNASQNFAQSLKVRQRARVSPYLPAFLALLKNPENPDIEGTARELGLQSLVIHEQFVHEFLNSKGIQISSIAAVIGGLLAQEILNYLTAQEYPIQNTLIYDAKEGKGPVYYITS